MSNSNSAFKKILAILLSLCFAFSGNSMMAFADDEEPSSEATDGIQVLLYQDDNIYEYKTGSQITMYSGISVTGNETELHNAYVITTIPKTWLDTSYGIVPSKSAGTLSKNPTVTEDDDNYYLRYDFATIQGGTIAEIPFTFKTKNNTTPDGTTFDLITKVYNEDGDELVSSPVRTITNLATYGTNISRQQSIYNENSDRYNETRTSENLDENMVVGTYATISPAITSTSALGRYIPSDSKVKITYTLADGVVFDKSYNSANANWEYDEETRTLTRIVNYPSSAINYWAYFKMPDVPYGTYNDAFTASFVVLDSDGNEIEETRKTATAASQIRINKPSYKYGLTMSKSISPWNITFSDSQKDVDRIWNITVGKPITAGYQTVYLGKLEDYGLNSHLYYTGIKLYASSNFGDTENLEVNELWGVTASGEEVKLATNVPLNEIYYIDESNHLDKNNVFRKLYFVFPNKVELSGNDKIYAKVYTKVFEEDWEQENEGTRSWFLGGSSGLVNTYIYNYVRGYFYQTREATSGSSAYSQDYMRFNKSAVERVTASGKNTTCNLEDITTITITPAEAVTGDLNGNSYLEDGKIIILIPDGWEYVNEGSNTTKITYNKLNATGGYTSVTQDISPEIVYDYNGTGKRALVIDLPEDAYHYSSNSYNTGIGTVTLNLQATTSTPSGTSTVEAYLVHGDDGITPSNGVTDVNDMDGDGDTTDKVSKATVDIKYIEPREIVGVKKVGTTLNNLSSSGSSTLDIGGEFYYGFTIMNLTKTVTVRSLDFLDILPSVGDKAIIKNQAGDYVSRGSEYRVEITGPVKAVVDGELVDTETVGYKVLYSTDVPVQGDFFANRSKTFSETVDDYSKVTMIKMVMIDGAEIPSGEEINFAVTAKVPEDYTIEDGSIAFNSFAYAAGSVAGTTFSDSQFVEALKVVTPVATYKVTGTVYRDFNLDEELNTQEKRIENVTVGLYDADGNEVGRTTTDENGYYSFDVYDRGDYTVKIIDKPSRYSFTSEVDQDTVFPSVDSADTNKASVDGKTVGDDVDGDGVSQTFTLDPQHKTHVVNAPLYDPTISIDVTKVWEIEAPDVDEIEVQLVAEGSDDTKTLTVKKSDDWKGQFTGLLKTDENDEVIKYSIKETTNLADYKSKVSGNQKDGFVVTNTYKRTPVTIAFNGVKQIEGNEDVTDPTGSNDRTFTFELKETTAGATYEDTATITGAGSYSFDSITFDEPGTYTYEVKEVSGSDKGYTYSNVTHEITVNVTDRPNSREIDVEVIGANEDGSGLDFTNTYEAEPTSVEFTGLKTLKVTGGNNRSLESEEYSFQLKDRRTGEVIETVKNDADGNITFSEIEYNSVGKHQYQIVEVEGSDHGITYDTTTYNVDVDVIDDGSGQLKTEISGLNQDGSGANFENEYKPDSATLTLGGHKTANGTNHLSESQQKEFTFHITEDGGDNYSASVVGSGDYSFPTITYNKVGTHTYTVTEEQGNDKGYSYSNKTYEVTVKVTDDGKGHLIAEATSDGEDVSDGSGLDFTNSYNPDSVKLSFKGVKALEGNDAELKAGDFAFVLKDTKTDKSWTAKNNADGEFSFDNIEFIEVGEHELQLEEVIGDKAGVEYSSKIYNFNIEVTDDGSGELTYEVVGSLPSGVKINDSSDTVTGFDFTNKYEASETSIILGGHKYLVNDEGKDGGKDIDEADRINFTFKLVGVSDNAKDTEMTTSAQAYSDFMFPEMIYDESGTYVYEVSEVDDSNKSDKHAGYEYSSDVYTVTVVVAHSDSDAEYYIESATAVKKDSTDTTSIDCLTGTGLDFTNIYDADPAEVSLAGSKTINGKALDKSALKDKEFTFTLKNRESGETIQTVNNAADGSFSFDKLTFDEVGTYTYQISETSGNAHGVTYDDTIYNVTVTVTDNGTGKLQAKVTGLEDDGATFDNKYEPDSTSIKLGGHKTVNGDENVAGGSKEEFTFHIEEEGGYSATVTGSGDYKFPEITYDKVGKHVYTVTETSGTSKGYEYSKQTYEVTVDVVDDGEGHLVATATTDGEDISDGTGLDFVNTYTAAPTSIKLNANKTFEALNGSTKEMEAGDYNFNLTNIRTGEVVDTKSNAEDGSVAFDEIRYDTVGTYRYRISETNDNQNGVTYDDATYDITVTVTDSGNGQLEAVATSNDDSIVQKGNEVTGATFENTYEPEAVSVTLGGEKSIEGLDNVTGDTEKEFTFNLEERGLLGIYTDVDTATVNGEGTYEFDSIEFTEVGEYTYRVTESKGNDKGYTYDDNKYTVKINVTDDEDGHLVAEITEGAKADGTGLDFKNSYESTPTKVQFSGYKVVAGLDNVDGNRDREFNFNLEETTEGASYSDSASRNGAGQFKFDEIEYTETGVYTYEISEETGDAAGYSYSDKTYEVTVTVTDDGSGELNAAITGLNKNGSGADFTNTYSPEPVSLTFTGNKTVEGLDKVTGDKAKTFTFELKENIQEDESDSADDNQNDSTEGDGSEVGDGTQTGDDSQNVSDDQEEKEKPSAYSETVTTKGAGEITFSEIVYTTPGTYNYTVSEIEGDDAGYTYSTKSYDVTVNVRDDGNGQLTAEVTSDDRNIEQDEEEVTGIDFTNSYKAKGTSINISGKKTLDGTRDETTGAGKEFNAGDYTFQLKDKATGEVIEEVSNDADGNIEFSELKYNEVGTYLYQVVEKIGDAHGVTYSSEVYDVIVDVVDDGNGELKASISGDVNSDGSGADFENSYKPDSVSVILGGHKTIEGADDVTGGAKSEFTFNLEETTEGSDYVDEATVSGAGDYRFNSISYDKVGKYTYKVTEVQGQAEGYTYSQQEYEVTVTVTDDGDGHLLANIEASNESGESVDATNASGLDFTNSYTAKAVVTPEFSGTKTLAGRKLKDEEFTFILKDSDGNVVEEVNNDASGNISFEEIEFAKAGTYTYTIEEDKGSDKNITYDKTVYEVTVNVVDDETGQLKATITGIDSDGSGVDFKNKYVAAKGVKTGDNINILLLMLLMTLSLIGIVGNIVYRRRYNE